MDKKQAALILIDDQIERLSYEVADGNFCGIFCATEAAFELCFIGNVKCRTSRAREIISLVSEGLESLGNNEIMVADGSIAKYDAMLADMVERLAPWNV